MKTARIISLYRKAKNGDEHSKTTLQNEYVKEQFYHLPKDLYDWSGLMGHSSAFYTAELYKKSYNYNRELYEALCYAADSYLQDEERMAN